MIDAELVGGVCVWMVCSSPTAPLPQLGLYIHTLCFARKCFAGCGGRRASMGMAASCAVQPPPGLARLAWHLQPSGRSATSTQQQQQEQQQRQQQQQQQQQPDISSGAADGGAAGCCGAADAPAAEKRRRGCRGGAKRRARRGVGVRLSDSAIQRQWFICVLTRVHVHHPLCT